MQTDQNWIIRTFNFTRENVVPLAALVSFFPIYFWSYVYSLPREVRLLLDTAFYTSIAFEFVMACAACGLIARFSAYQLTTSANLFMSFSSFEPRFIGAQSIIMIIKKISPYLQNDTKVTLIIFLFAITAYFVGILGMIFVSLYLLVLFSAFGSSEKALAISRGNISILESGNLQLAIKTLSTLSIQQILARHINFFSLAVLVLPFCLGLGRFVSLVNNNDVVLSINSTKIESKLIASTDAGLIFMASADAKALRLITWRPTDYYLLMQNGTVVCFGERNTACIF